jgi:dienelactone hydrolase
MRRLVFAFACVIAACGDDAPTGGPSVRFALPASGLPQPLAVPFPSDVYLDSDGTIVDSLTDWTLASIDEPEPSAMFGQYGAIDGFGLQSGVVFGIDGFANGDTVDPATLTADHALLVDVDSGITVPCQLGWDAFAHTITIVPEDSLAAGHRYAAGLLAGPKFMAGGAIAASAGFRSVRDSHSGVALYTDAIAALVAAGAARDQLIGATLYTTATYYQRSLATASRLYGGSYGPAPALNTTTVAAPFIVTRFGRTTHPGWTATLDEWLGTPRRDSANRDLPGYPGDGEPSTTGMGHDAIAAIVSGTIVSPWFPRPFTKTADYDDGTTAYDGAGNAIAAQPAATIPVTIVVPAGSPPTGGFPVVIFQHGLGGQRLDALSIANELARNGIATVAVDGPLHGLRDSTAADAHSNFPGTYTGPDGFADHSNPLILLDAFGNLRSMLRARDVVWQFAYDLISLRRMIDTLDLTALADEFGGTAPTLDASHVGLVGWSLGGWSSILFSAMTPRASLDPVVFVSPASNIAAAFGESPVYYAQQTLIAAALNVHSAALDAGRLSATVQILEGLAGTADTAAFAPIVSQNHVAWLMTALEDESVPHTSTDQLARSLGAIQLTPNVRAAARVPQAPSPLVPDASGHLVGFHEVSPGNHSHVFERHSTLGYEPPYPRPTDPRFVELPHRIAVRQTPVGEQRAIAAFMLSTWNGTPTIATTDPSFLGLAPVADFDDDGYCDDAEVAAGTNPFDPASKPTGTPTCTRDVGFTP